MAKFEQKQVDMSYRIYLTTVLRQMVRWDSTKDWYKLIRNGSVPRDTRSGDEIAADIMRRLKEE